MRYLLVVFTIFSEKDPKNLKNFEIREYIHRKLKNSPVE